MKKIIKLTESDLARIVRRVIKEENDDENEVEVTPEMIIRMLMDSAESTPQENYDDLYDWMQDVFSPVEVELEDMGYDIDDLRMTYDDVIMSLWDGDDDWDDDEDEEDDESLYESDITRIVKRVINEAEAGSYPPECQNIKQFMDAMSKTNKLSFKIETGVSYGPLGGELLILTDPNGRACRVTKKEFFQFGI